MSCKVVPYRSVGSIWWVSNNEEMGLSGKPTSPWYPDKSGFYRLFSLTLPSGNLTLLWTILDNDPVIDGLSKMEIFLEEILHHLGWLKDVKSL